MWSPTATVRAEHHQAAEEDVLQLEGRSLRDHADRAAGHAGQARLSPGRAQHDGQSLEKLDSEEVPLLDDVQEELLNAPVFRSFSRFNAIALAKLICELFGLNKKVAFSFEI